MSDKRQFEIRFEGRFADEHVMPVAALSQAQKMVHGARVFEFLHPLELAPTLDEETRQLYCLEQAGLGIDVYAYTRDQFDLELKEQLAFLWDTYAQASDEELTGAAITLKRNLLQALREITHAA